MLTERDAGALVEAAAGAAEPRDYEREAIAILERGIGFDVAIYRRGLDSSAYNLDPRVELACRPYWSDFRRDVSPVFKVALGQGGVAIDVEVLGLRRMESLSYYQRLMRPHHGTATAMVCMTQRGVMTASLSLGRAGRGFRGRELEQLRALTPALSVCEAAVSAQPRALATGGAGAGLTRREVQVLSHLPLGHTNAQIALALGTAERTVRNQLSRIFEKLEVGSRAEAAALYLQLGLGRG